ncbi:MAG: hypothetical protein DIU69_08080 [Bacillota bacterium]|nr:MAG: hypothetical protein DIU69_08080 [Bacillota bacterium]
MEGLSAGALRGAPALFGGGALNTGHAVAVGIDPSLTRLALAVAGAREETASFHARGYSGVPRLRVLRDQALAWIRQHQPSVVVMEGYSMAAKAGRLADLGELGGVLKTALWDEGYREEDGTLVVVTPAQLKKFATGRGNAEKAAVVSAVARRWGVEVDTDDEADAYVLARIGLALLGGEESLTAYQRDVMQRIRTQSPGWLRLGWGPPTRVPQSKMTYIQARRSSGGLGV